jgi:hypothetical protein
MHGHEEPLSARLAVALQELHELLELSVQVRHPREHG